MIYIGGGGRLEGVGSGTGAFGGVWKYSSFNLGSTSSVGFNTERRGERYSFKDSD
jgi:hypothetical protein